MTNDVQFQLNRRQLLQFAGLGAASLALASCSAAGTGNIPKGNGSWKQFAGTEINFISENTAPSAAIAANSKPFTDLTGIKVNISQMQLGDLVQKVKLDLSSGSSQYHVIYADPYQVMSPLSAGLADLTPLISSSGYPKVEGGLDDFLALDAAGRFLSKDKLYALPYDCPTMIWFYRKDLFEKYHTRMTAALGFDPTPSEKITWEQYYQIADWFNRNAKSDVAYGTGHQAKQYDSLQCDFSNVLWAYGGDYFGGTDLGPLGSKDPGKSTLTDDAAVKAATFYQKLLGIAHPGSVGWDWDGLGQAFAAGQVAMAPNWHEYAASAEEKFPGKVGYSLLPTGPARSANLWGGTGIGINANAKEKEFGAAWLFVNWATAPATQLMTLRSTVGGGTPTRRSVYALPEVKAQEKWPSTMPNMVTTDVVLKAWEPDFIGLRPKVATWNQLNTAVFTELSKMITGSATPAATMASIAQQFDTINAK
ncbi:extracellular solute-binding protein [Galbitalea soli]|uniref:Extracellular solute-binding protein n=1 Tax=Galbitalea soli TaxID=1268042 RepID=A0A7C9TPU1_9MICO|nr:extracellular solute-binding protein [Galbitalea soli]NEM90164.1 extracellular solute-binding protein [Galbitalea soli]NYJ30872.1 multiple sugar transport system substrate-binding protein [Galbitalea soli]